MLQWSWLSGWHSHGYNTDEYRLSAKVPRPARAQDRNKPVLFSMARLDRVKNLTGLAEMYAKNERLRAVCNLVIVGGIVDPSQVRSPAYSVNPEADICSACSLVVGGGIVDPLRVRWPVQ